MMKFPNKFITYKDSVVYKMPKFLHHLKNCDLSLKELYKKTNKDVNNIQEFIDVLDCLFMLGEIEIKGEIIHYVKRN